jgi:hypothetical protein
LIVKETVIFSTSSGVLYDPSAVNVPSLKPDAEAVVAGGGVVVVTGGVTGAGVGAGVGGTAEGDILIA